MGSSRAARPPGPRLHGPGTHQVRIVGGRWRRTPVPVVAAAGLRPTPDRVRETLFNWLGQHLDGRRCLDVFAGTGVLGLEAASRGALEVIAIEHDAKALSALRAMVRRLDAGATVNVVAGDVHEVLTALAAARAHAFDVVFVDPPFREGWIARLMPVLVQLLAPSGRLYVEAEASIADLLGPISAPGLVTLREARAGQVHYHLLTAIRGDEDPLPCS